MVQRINNYKKSQNSYKFKYMDLLYFSYEMKLLLFSDTNIKNCFQLLAETRLPLCTFVMEVIHPDNTCAPIRFSEISGLLGVQIQMPFFTRCCRRESPQQTTRLSRSRSVYLSSRGGGWYFANNTLVDLAPLNK